MSRDAAIQDLLGYDAIKEMALLSNVRYGRAIYERGGQRRRVQFEVTAKGLKWHCAGNLKNHQIFCKHCVALALAINKLATPD